MVSRKKLYFWAAVAAAYPETDFEWQEEEEESSKAREYNEVLLRPLITFCRLGSMTFFTQLVSGWWPVAASQRVSQVRVARRPILDCLYVAYCSSSLLAPFQTVFPSSYRTNNVNSGTTTKNGIQSWFASNILYVQIEGWRNRKMPVWGHLHLALCNRSLQVLRHLWGIVLLYTFYTIICVAAPPINAASKLNRQRLQSHTPVRNAQGNVDTKSYICIWQTCMHPSKDLDPAIVWPK